MPTSLWPVLGPLLAVLLGGGLIASLVAYLRLRSEKGKTSAETGISYENLADRYRARIATLEAALGASGDLVEHRDAEVAAARAEVAHLKLIAPGLTRLLLLQAHTSEDVSWLLEFTEADLWLLSSQLGNGRHSEANASILWTSRNWTEALRRPREDLYGTGWYALVSPDTRKATVLAEASALMTRVRVANKYLCGDGTWLCLEWRALSYEPGSGLSVARARIVGRTAADGATLE